MSSVQITPQWQDVSGGFPYVDISAADNALHTGGQARGFEASKRIAASQPAADDAGEGFLVGSVPQRIVARGSRLWLKVPPGRTQFSAVVALSEPMAPIDSPIFTGDPIAPTPLPGDNDNSLATTAFVQGEIAGFVPWFDAATLAAANFHDTPPPYVDIKCGDGRDQRFQVVTDYPVSVIERLGNPDFSTADFWGVPAGSSITGGNLVYTANSNVTQTGLRPTVVGGTYEVTVNVSSYTSGTLTPQLLTPGTVPVPPAITAAGVTTRRITTAAALTAFRLAGTATSVMTVASASFKRVMTNACIVSADGRIWAPAGDINVKAYGVVADGTTDDTAALTNAIAIAYNLGRKAILPAAQMRVTGQIVDFLASGLLQIEGDPARTIIVNEMTAAGSMFSIQGRFDAWNATGIYLTAAAAQAARTLTLNDTSQLTVNQDIQLKDFSQPIEYHDKIYSDDETRISSLNGEINRVNSIDSATQITLGSQLEMALTPRVVLTGTVSTTTNVNVVTGVGTTFDVDLVPHQYVSIAGVSSGNPLKVRKIVSATVLWIDIAATPVSNTVSGAAITKLGTVVQRFLDRTEAQVSGVRVIGNPAVTVPFTNIIYDCRGLRRASFRSLGFLAAGCAEISLWRSLRARIVDYYSEDAGRPGKDSYCIKLLDGVRGVQIVNGYAMRPRHFITTTNDEAEIEAAYVLLSNCHVDQAMLAAYDMHPGGKNWLFSNCSCQGNDFDGQPTVGFQPRGHDVTLVNCQASGCTYGLNLAYGYNTHVNSFLAVGCEISLNATQTHHVDVRNFISRNALTNDVRIGCRYNTSGLPPLPGISIHGHGEGNPSGPSVALISGYPWGADWKLDFRNIDAAVKYDAAIPSSHTHGIIDKVANFSVVPNLSCVYRTTGTVTATLPLLSADTGEATYTFTEVSGALTIDGNGAETIDGVASITPTGTVRVKKNGETGAWVTIG